MIEDWLRKFEKFWLAKDVDAVLGLFSDDVEYWETPFLRLNKNTTLREEWEGIKALRDMEMEHSVYSADGGSKRYAVLFNFMHAKSQSAGVYLVGLNKEGLCNYFYRVSVSK